MQKSVFIFSGSRSALEATLGDLAKLIDPAVDRLQSWPIAETVALRRFDFGAALPPCAHCVVASPTGLLILEDNAPPPLADPPLTV